MALSAEIKHKIVRFLGFSAKSIILGSTHYKSALADALANLDEVSEQSLIELVSRIERIDERLDGALDRLSAIRLDDIELRADEIEKLRSERSRLIKEVGYLIDIAPQSMGVTGGVSSVGVCV
jgi:hypothetical protein